MEILKNLRKNRSKSIFIAAPICGFSRFPFRQILSKFPLSLLFTEMVSIDALYYSNPATLPILHFDIEDNIQTAVQMVGSKLDFFVKAVLKLKERGFLYYDINLGCPVKKVLKNHAGSYLLKEPEKIYQILKTLSSTFPDLGFTAKIRLGFDQNQKNYLEVSQAVEEGGAKFISVHGRTRSQMYSGEIDYEAISEIKKSVKIPVIGNGNIFSVEDAKKMYQTGCDGIMFARGIIGNPWLVKQVDDYLADKVYSWPSNFEKIDLMEKNLDLELQFDPRNGFREFKKLAVKYLKGVPGASKFRQELLLSKDSVSLKGIIQKIRDFLTEYEKTKMEKK